MERDQVRAAARGDGEALRELVGALKAPPADLAGTLAAAPPVELARLVLQLKPKHARAMLRLLPDAPSLAVLAEIDPAVNERLLDDDQRARLARIVAKLGTADAADFLAEAPPSVVESVLAALDQPADLIAALGYRNESAGALMQRRLVAAPADWTVGQLIDEIRRNSEQIDRIYAVYVIDADRKLVGYLKVRDLILNPATTVVGDVMRTPVTAVAADTDREEVSRIAERENLYILPVVDADGVLIGRVTPEELVDIDRAEAEEDAKLMAGLAPDATASDGPLKIVPRRLPWLAGGLIGSSIAALVVGSYEDALTEAAILATLIPIVMSLAGNAGIQASTVTVQAMSAGAFWAGDIGGRILREIGGAALNGGLIGLIVGIAIMALSFVVPIERAHLLALTAALTLIVVTVQASTIGSMIPVVLRRLGFDPAVATGVFITTSNDVVGVLVFFVIATAVYL
ncbi:MAG: magnesium transporter [Pseudomonadota bacterium]